MQQDNTGIAKRILHDRIVKVVIPKVNKAFNTAEGWPSGLRIVEEDFKAKLYRPRSVYEFKVLEQLTNEYRLVEDTPYTTGPDLLEDLFPDHPFRGSKRWSFDAKLERNKRALKKGGSLPNGGDKQSNFAAAVQYVNEVIFPGNSIDKMFSILIYHRTQQQNAAGDTKVRPVHGFPTSTWYIEGIAFDDGITLTIKANGGDSNRIKLFYCEPGEIHRWFQNQSSGVVCWVNIDATGYDRNVGASELAVAVQHLAGGYEFTNLVSDYIIRASLVMPAGDIHRNGGQPSGSKQTNWGDALTNLLDHLEALSRLGLLKYLRCVLINGDDITFGFSTWVTAQNREKWARYSRREINPSKSHTGKFGWNSKWYIDDEIMTRPVYRVLNSLMFKEHQTNPITGSKEYVAIATAQQLEDLADHPLADLVLREVKRIDKYPVEAFTAKELRPAMEAYVDDHNWSVDWMSTVDDRIQQLQTGAYAKA
jgi:hypothetical protein